MDLELWFHAVTVLLLLLLSAFFSSVESAYFSLSRSAVERMRESTDPRARRVVRLLDDPRRLLASILTGNTVVNTAAAAIAALMGLSLAGKWGVEPGLVVGVEVLVMAAIILFFSELTPKLMALRDAEKWALRTSYAVKFACYLLTPLAQPLAALTAAVSRLFGVEQRSVMAMSEKEIRALIQVGHEHGALELEERELIHSIFEFGDTIVREVMVPRIDIVAVEVRAPLDVLLETVSSKGHSRIPVYRENIDDIIGLIHAKDLLAYTQDPEKFELEKILRSVVFVPEEKKIDDLLREFQTRKMHMAVVVDEYGGTAGLVTLEDILEEIQDEYDKEQPLARRVDDKTIIASGKMGIYDFNQMEGFELIPVSDAYDTLAGFVYRQMGVVPQKGQGFEFQGYRFIVDEVLGKRIIRVKVIKERGVFEGV